MINVEYRTYHIYSITFNISHSYPPVIWHSYVFFKGPFTSMIFTKFKESWVVYDPRCGRTFKYHTYGKANIPSIFINIQQYSTLFSIIQHYSTLSNIIPLFISLISSILTQHSTRVSPFSTLKAFYHPPINQWPVAPPRTLPTSKAKRICVAVTLLR